MGGAARGSALRVARRLSLRQRGPPPRGTGLSRRPAHSESRGRSRRVRADRGHDSPRRHAPPGGHGARARDLLRPGLVADPSGGGCHAARGRGNPHRAFGAPGWRLRAVFGHSARGGAGRATERAAADPRDIHRAGEQHRRPHPRTARQRAQVWRRVAIPCGRPRLERCARNALLRGLELERHDRAARERRRARPGAAGTGPRVRPRAHADRDRGFDACDRHPAAHPVERGERGRSAGHRGTRAVAAVPGSGDGHRWPGREGDPRAVPRPRGRDGPGRRGRLAGRVGHRWLCRDGSDARDHRGSPGLPGKRARASRGELRRHRPRGSRLERHIGRDGVRHEYPVGGDRHAHPARQGRVRERRHDRGPQRSLQRDWGHEHRNDRPDGRSR